MFFLTEKNTCRENIQGDVWYGIVHKQIQKTLYCEKVSDVWEKKYL